MPVCHEHHLVFVHIPKCAGTSVSQALSDAGCKLQFKGAASLRAQLEWETLWLHHLSARQLRLVLGEAVWSSYRKFSVVRNPWDRMVSQFHYRKAKAPAHAPIHLNVAAASYALANPGKLWKYARNQLRARLLPQATMRVLPGEDFGRWLQRQLLRCGVDSSFSCAGYLLGDDQTLLVDRVLRYERLEDEFAEWGRTLGLKVTLKRLRTSPHADYRSFYTPKQRDLVADCFAEDINRFDFTF